MGTHFSQSSTVNFYNKTWWNRLSVNLDDMSCWIDKNQKLINPTNLGTDISQFDLLRQDKTVWKKKTYEDDR